MQKFWNIVKSAFLWLKDHWYVPLFLVGVVLGFVVSGRVRNRGGVGEQTKAELEAIKAGAETRKVRAELGAEKARAHVEETHAETLEKLDDDQKAKARELRENPERLARFLVRSAR